MIKSEAKFQTRFGRWVKYNWDESSLFELKYERTGALAFAAVKAHQIQNLLNAKHRKIFWKIPDDSYSQKPADCFSLNRAQAYVAIQYEEDRQTFCLIDIDTFVFEMNTSDRKSLTKERAYEIGKICTFGTIE